MKRNSLSVAVILAATLLCSVYFGASQNPSATTAAGPANVSDSCRSCHKPEATEFGKTNHAHYTAAGKAAISCETCHGSGAAHIEAEQAARGDEHSERPIILNVFQERVTERRNDKYCAENGSQSGR